MSHLYGAPHGTKTALDAILADELLIDGDVRTSQQWREYRDVTPSDSEMVDAAGSNRKVVVVHAVPYGDEKVLLRAEE